MTVSFVLPWCWYDNNSADFAKLLLSEPEKKHVAQFMKYIV